MDHSETAALAAKTFNCLISDAYKAVRAEIYSDTLKWNILYDMRVDDVMPKCIRMAYNDGKLPCLPQGIESEALDDICKIVMTLMINYFEEKDSNLGTSTPGGY